MRTVSSVLRGAVIRISNLCDLVRFMGEHRSVTRTGFGNHSSKSAQEY